MMKRTSTLFAVASSHIHQTTALALKAPKLSFLSIPLSDPSLLPLISKDETTQSSEFHVLDPCAKSETDKSAIIATFSESMTKEDAKHLIDYSYDSFKKWRDDQTCLTRSEKLSNWSSLIKENELDISIIMSYETGKPLKESIGEIKYATSFLDFYASECLRPSAMGGGEIYPSTFMDSSGRTRGKIMATKEPIGVTCMITPWNFPIAMITRKVGPCLAAGCTAICKPSELTPLTAIAVHQLAIRAGIPDGVFQLCICDTSNVPDIGQEMCQNDKVRKISFTGSTKIGKLLMKQSSDTVKKVSLELGGNAPFIVFEDADIAQAVDSCLLSKFRNAGQTCVCADRFLIHESIEQEFLEQLIKKLKTNISVGSPFSSEVNTMGPLITSKAAQAIDSLVKDALETTDAELIYTGKLSEEGENFYPPTILRNVCRRSKIWTQETFAPTVVISTFSSEEEALEVANDTTTGLASYFFTSDLQRVFRVSRLLETGIVGVNDGIISTASAPFGGVKESGLGREGSIIGLEEYLETKYVFLNAD